MRRNYRIAPALFSGCLTLANFAFAASPAAGGQEPSRLREANCPNGSMTAGIGARSGLRDDTAGGKQTSRSIFYVSPKGRDDWTGRLQRPNPQRTDGPVATLEKARDLARATATPDVIVMGGGDYYLAQPVTFGPEDAGLVITAGCDGTPVLYGGPKVEGWKPASNGRWTARLQLPADARVGDLFVNGAVQTEARFPNASPDGDPRKGWLFAAKCAAEADTLQSNTRFCVHASDLPSFHDITGLVAHIVGGFQPGSQWGNDTLPVVSIDRKRSVVHTEGTSYFFTAEGSRYFLAGQEALLDAPGEWWYDQASGRLDYIPASAAFPHAATVVGVLGTFLVLKGADSMTISGLSLRDGAPEGTGKYGTDTRGYGAIRLDHANGVRLLGNVIQNVGVGIHVSESRNVTIAGNEIGPVAGNGIYLGTAYGSFGKSSGAKIVGNRIHDVGRVYFESAGIWFQAADDVTISHNLVENAAQFGIAGGSIWGPQDAVHNAVIEYNTVRNANRQTADGGAIKLIGAQADLMNSHIRHNLVTGTRELMNRADGTFWPSNYENTGEWPSPISWAIYTDGRASGVEIADNVLSDNVSAIGINGGWNNVVSGNIISRGSGAAFRVDDGTGRGWRPAWARPNLIENNVVSIDNDSGLAVFVYAPGQGADYVEFAGNRYKGNLNARSFEIEPAIMASGTFGSLGDFQAAGQEKGSVAGPAKGDGSTAR
ncbi:MAG: right-handed parallel beta-helix repeat-containing protein [Rhizobiaceae bacterium]